MKYKNQIIGIILLAIVLLLIFWPESNEPEQLDNENTLPETTDTVSFPESFAVNNVNVGGGIYTNYNPTLLTNAISGDVVLFFHADWCPDCNQLELDLLSKINTIPNDLTILKVDYDSSTELREKYDVEAQHTLVQVDEDGTEIKKWVGGVTLESIQGNLD